MQTKIDKLRELLTDPNGCFRVAIMVLTANQALFGDMLILHEDVDARLAELDAKHLTPTRFLQDLRELLLNDTSAFMRVPYSQNFHYSSMYDEFKLLHEQVKELLGEEKVDKRKKKEQQ